MYAGAFCLLSIQFLLCPCQHWLMQNISAKLNYQLLQGQRSLILLCLQVVWYASIFLEISRGSEDLVTQPAFTHHNTKLCACQAASTVMTCTLCGIVRQMHQLRCKWCRRYSYAQKTFESRATLQSLLTVQHATMLVIHSFSFARGFLAPLLKALKYRLPNTIAVPHLYSAERHQNI